MAISFPNHSRSPELSRRFRLGSVPGLNSLAAQDPRRQKLRGKAAVRLFPLALRPIQRGNVTNRESTQRNTVAVVLATVSFPSSFNI
jgi:hypothetical protein